MTYSPTYNSLRQELSTALADLEREALHGSWSGKSYREYWDWFDARAEVIAAMATDRAERYAVDGLLLDLTDSAHESYGVPADRADDVITRP
jgi:hypothetical protein